MLGWFPGLNFSNMPMVKKTRFYFIYFIDVFIYFIVVFIVTRVYDGQVLAIYLLFKSMLQSVRLLQTYSGDMTSIYLIQCLSPDHIFSDPGNSGGPAIRRDKVELYFLFFFYLTSPFLALPHPFTGSRSGLPAPYRGRKHRLCNPHSDHYPLSHGY